MGRARCVPARNEPKGMLTLTLSVASGHGKTRQELRDDLYQEFMRALYANELDTEMTTFLERYCR